MDTYKRVIEDIVASDKSEGDLIINRKWFYSQFANDKNIVYEAIKKKNYCLSWASELIRDTYEPVIQACRTKGENYIYASDRLKLNYKIGMISCLENPNIYHEHLRWELKHNPKFTIEFLSNRPSNIDTKTESIIDIFQKWLILKKNNLIITSDYTVTYHDNKRIVFQNPSKIVAFDKLEETLVLLENNDENRFSVT